MILVMSHCLVLIIPETLANPSTGNIHNQLVGDFTHYKSFIGLGSLIVVDVLVFFDLSGNFVGLWVGDLSWSTFLSQLKGHSQDSVIYWPGRVYPIKACLDLVAISVHLESVPP
ncbi:hypothetical protein EI94DRAFT_1702964 [Lactarius quietus]|nr:hypothetical protein EI94DRAFT_1702964 [Lactarius quietus]